MLPYQGHGISKVFYKNIVEYIFLYGKDWSW
jgi:hypothetical protein